MPSHSLAPVTVPRLGRDSHHPLISCPCVFQTKRHYVVAVQSMGRDEGCFLRIRQVHKNLMVSEEGVQKR